MARNLRLFAAGLLPLLIGVVQNRIMTAGFVRGVFLMSLVCLAAWGWLAFLLSDKDSGQVVQAFCLCTVGLLVLLLLMYQELVLGAYWGGAAGLLPQLYFLPFLSAAIMVTNLLANGCGMWLVFAVSWLGMLAASWLGCYMKRRRG